MQENIQCKTWYHDGRVADRRGNSYTRRDPLGIWMSNTSNSACIWNRRANHYGVAKRAGNQCQRVHEALVENGNVKSQHIQADEIRAKGRKMIIWIALAMDVTTRLWMAGAVSHHRDHKLIDLS